MSKIAILGYGVVGSGTVEVFYKNKEIIESKTGGKHEIKYILDIRSFPESPYAEKFVTNFEIILNDPEIEVVAEFIGGKTHAYDFVKRSLIAGKSVVTSNKELVASYGAELLQTARDHSVNFFFEASVGGGIPIIRPLHQCLMSDRITGVAGILNGTTNYILTKMTRENMEFGKALAMAQELGYAESNPADDIEGRDTCRKICILASLVFGKHVYPESAATEGITRITPQDLEYAENCRCAVKLVGYAGECDSTDKKISVGIGPVFVPEENQLANVNDVFNAILINGEATGEVLFYGKGAGKYPTASAVVSDIVNALKMSRTSKSLDWSDTGNQDFIVDGKLIERRFYVRTTGFNKDNAVKLFGNITELSRKGKPDDEFAFITGKINEKELYEKLKEINVLSIMRIFEL